MRRLQRRGSQDSYAALRAPAQIAAARERLIKGAAIAETGEENGTRRGQQLAAEFDLAGAVADSSEENSLSVAM